MGIFDDAVVNAKAAASAVGKKAENIFDVTKLKITESGILSSISKKNEELGLEVYKNFKDSFKDDSQAAKIIGELNELYEQLDATRSVIAQSKNKICCPACKSELDKDSVYCNKCGLRLQKEEAEEEQSQSQNVEYQKSSETDYSDPEFATEINQAD